MELGFQCLQPLPIIADCVGLSVTMYSHSRGPRLRIAVVTLLTVSACLILNDQNVAMADPTSQLTLPSASGINVSLRGGPHKWAGCTIVNGVLQSDCLYHDSPWN